MPRTKTDPTVVRPRCPEHPDNKVWLDGFERCGWSDAHRRPRYRCVTPEGTRGHSFSLPVAVRQPTEQHPDTGATCPTCTRTNARHEGVTTGRGFVFGHGEIARLLLRVGEGMSLREASRDLRETVLRQRRDDHAVRGASRQATLAVDHVDAFANELRPDQVTRASGREVVWRCEAGHEWSAAVYQRTLSGSGCPECYRLEAADRSRAGKRRARTKMGQAA